jgi:hypothetical protein
MRFKLKDLDILCITASKVRAMSCVKVISISWDLLEATRTALEREARKVSIKDATDRASDFAEDAVGSRTLRLTCIEDMGVSYETPPDRSRFRDEDFNGLDALMKVSKSYLEPGKGRLTWKVQAKFAAKMQ